MSECRAATLLHRHVEALRACERCPRMLRPAVSGGAVFSRIISVGQAPGSKEPILGRPFAWTAGRTLFGWFEKNCGVDEEAFRGSVYMAAVCRCFPGKTTSGGDRVPGPGEIAACSHWLERELELLRPGLIIAIGKLAIAQFLPPAKLDTVIGRKFTVTWRGRSFDLIPLPHPSGASPWHRMEPGRSLLEKALSLISDHAAFRETFSARKRCGGCRPANSRQTGG